MSHYSCPVCEQHYNYCRCPKDPVPETPKTYWIVDPMTGKVEKQTTLRCLGLLYYFDHVKKGTAFSTEEAAKLGAPKIVRAHIENTKTYIKDLRKKVKEMEKILAEKK